MFNLCNFYNTVSRLLLYVKAVPPLVMKVPHSQRPQFQGRHLLHYSTNNINSCRKYDSQCYIVHTRLICIQYKVLYTAQNSFGEEKPSEYPEV